jgi:hypothetical protein
MRLIINIIFIFLPEDDGFDILLRPEGPAGFWLGYFGDL